MSNATETHTQTTIIHPAGGKGGTGKTITMVGLTDYLRSKKYKISLVDCDAENAGQPGSFGHWCGGKQVDLNLRVREDRDRLLLDAAQSGCDYVLVDFPSNASGDLFKWLKEAATARTIQAMGLRLITVCVITPEPSSVHSAIKWVTMMGDRSNYLIALNRIDYEAIDTPARKLFADWFETALPELVPSVVSEDRIRTIEVSNLEEHRMKALAALGKLPSRALESGGLNLLHQSAVRIWRDALFASLDATGWFKRANRPEKAGTAAN
jgi:cellulose biosynthesis protein BcsQ